MAIDLTVEDNNGVDFQHSEAYIYAISPSAKIEESEDGAVITIKDKDGETVVILHNGKDGKDGADGQNGKDGHDGAQGPPGERGPQGERGEQGPKGDTGLAGPQGPKGDKGDTGSDASVTAANIQTALGYVPANPSDIPTVSNDFTDTYKAEVDALWNDYQSAMAAMGIGGE